MFDLNGIKKAGTMDLLHCVSHEKVTEIMVREALRPQFLQLSGVALGVIFGMMLALQSRRFDVNSAFYLPKKNVVALFLLITAVCQCLL